MDYFENHLPKNEKIIARSHKSLMIFCRELLVAIVLVAIILGLQLGAKLQMDIMMWIYVACAIILLLFICGSIVKYSSTILVVTTHKFMVKEDLVTIKTFETLLSNIDGIEVEYTTPLRRALKVGNITIRTRSSEHTYRNITHPDLFAAVLNRQTAINCEKNVNAVTVSFGIANNMQKPKEEQVIDEPAPKKKGKIIKGQAK